MSCTQRPALNPVENTQGPALTPQHNPDGGGWLQFFFLVIGLLGVLHSVALCLYYGRSTTAYATGVPGLFLLVYAGLLSAKKRDNSRLLPPQGRRIITAGIAGGALLLGAMAALMAQNATDSAGRDDAQSMIILGAGLRGRELTATLRNRLETACAYLHTHPWLPVIVCGGQGKNEEISEALAMRDFLVAQGIAPGRVLMEDRSTSTWENFVFARRIFQQRDGRVPEKLLIVTSGFHLMRAKFLAGRAGFRCAGLASATPLLVIVNCYVRECFALVKSYFLDRPE